MICQITLELTEHKAKSYVSFMLYSTKTHVRCFPQVVSKIFCLKSYKNRKFGRSLKTNTLNKLQFNISFYHSVVSSEKKLADLN